MPRDFAFPSGPGGFVLLGDAAHAMSHHLGQGACLALEDAATLQTLVREAIPGRTLGRRWTRYTRERRPRLARIMRQSRRVGAVYSANGPLAVRARDAALGLSPHRLLSRASSEPSASGTRRSEPERRAAVRPNGRSRPSRASGAERYITIN